MPTQGTSTPPMVAVASMVKMSVVAPGCGGHKEKLMEVEVIMVVMVAMARWTEKLES